MSRAVMVFCVLVVLGIVTLGLVACAKEAREGGNNYIEVNHVEQSALNEEASYDEEKKVEEVDEWIGMKVGQTGLEQGFYVMKENGIYTLNTSTKTREFIPDREYAVGYDSPLDWGFYWGGYDVCCTYGDITPIVVQRDDKIVYFADQGDPWELNLYPVIGSGYTVGLQRASAGGSLIYESEEGSKVIPTSRAADLANVCISDGNGPPVPAEERTTKKANFLYCPNLEYGKTYMLSWYEGTQYHEKEMVANWRYYIKEDTNENLIKLTGTLTKNGYAEYDFSQVPSGMYAVMGRNVIVIE